MFLHSHALGDWGKGCLHGPSASSSSSTSSTTNNSSQVSVQGASGQQSPTITAGKNVSYNDSTLQLATVNTLGDVIKQALSGTGAIAQQSQKQVNDVLQNQSNQQQQDSALLNDLLTANSQLTTYQGSGGAIQQSASTNYLVWGVIAIAIVFILTMGNRRTA